MHKANLAELPCSLARTLQVVGEWWTLLVLRDVCFGVQRFDAIQAHLGIARNILATRLGTLVEHGLVERSRYQRRPDRYEYVATEAGRDLVPAMMALVAWGDRWVSPAPPVLFEHVACGHDTAVEVVCGHCATPVTAGDLVPHQPPTPRRRARATVDRRTGGA
jgi:DNA-binding HxlR family transcriptional regulator